MDGCHSLAHTHTNYQNVVWESDQSAGTSAHAHLHYQHVTSVHALSSKVTHVANQPRLATPCLPHDDDRDTTPECVCVCVHVCVCMEEQDRLQADGRQMGRQQQGQTDGLLHNLKGWQTRRYADRQTGMQADYA